MDLPNLLLFLLASYGATNIITSGKIFEKPRLWLDKYWGFAGHWARCPMCIGVPVGVLLGLPFLESVGTIETVYRSLMFGFASSGWSWISRVVLKRLGEDSL